MLQIFRFVPQLYYNKRNIVNKSISCSLCNTNRYYYCYKSYGIVCGILYLIKIYINRIQQQIMLNIKICAAWSLKLYLMIMAFFFSFMCDRCILCVIICTLKETL